MEPAYQSGALRLDVNRPPLTWRLKTDLINFMDISVEPHSVQPGDTVYCTVRANIDKPYDNIQIDVYTCGTKNSVFKWGKGKTFDSNKDETTFAIDTSSLDDGYYEVQTIKLHNESNNDEIVLVGGQDYNRVFFHVSDSTISRYDLLSRNVMLRESIADTTFLSGYNIQEKGQDTNTYSVFVFVSGVLISRSMRIENFEIRPFRGLDRKENVEIVNDFMKNKCKKDIRFEYSDKIRENSRRSNPTFVSYFPHISAGSKLNVYEFVKEKTNKLIDVLSILRGGDGDILNMVIFNHDNRESELCTPREVYKGNLLTGNLSGESPEEIATYFDKIQNEYNRYLFSLFKQAIAESNSDFEYLRYWQILESITERRNYNESKRLRNVSGEIMYHDDDKNNPMRLKNGAKYKVYHLLYKFYTDRGRNESENLAMSRMKINDGEEMIFTLWQFVKAWYAFRNATAHFGGFRPNDPDQKDGLDYYEECKEASEYIDRVGRDFILSNLKETVKWVLLREV